MPEAATSASRVRLRHRHRECKPCDFNCRSQCRFGAERHGIRDGAVLFCCFLFHVRMVLALPRCLFCHLCGPAESRRWKKERKKFWRQWHWRQWQRQQAGCNQHASLLALTLANSCLEPMNAAVDFAVCRRVTMRTSQQTGAKERKSCHDGPGRMRAQLPQAQCEERLREPGVGKIGQFFKP